MALAGWWAGQRQSSVAYLIEENRILRTRLRGRICLTDDERRRLAVHGHPLGRRRLGQVATIVTPDTILRWHRQLIAGDSKSTASEAELLNSRRRFVLSTVTTCKRSSPSRANVATECSGQRVVGACAVTRHRGHRRRYVCRRQRAASTSADSRPIDTVVHNAGRHSPGRHNRCSLEL